MHWIKYHETKKINLKSLLTYSTTHSLISNTQFHLYYLQPYTTRVKIVTKFGWCVVVY